jgi:hypothetical protein
VALDHLHLHVRDRSVAESFYSSFRDPDLNLIEVSLYVFA